MNIILESIALLAFVLAASLAAGWLAAMNLSDPEFEKDSDE